MKPQSLWQDSVPPIKLSPLQGDISTDVLIVGAGITGLTTALILKQAGKRVTVVDQQGIGQGETGHTTAHITYVTDTRLNELCERVGEDHAMAFWEAGLLAMNKIVSLAGGSDCDLRYAPGYLFAAPTQNAEDEKPALLRDAELAVRFGFDAEMVIGDPFFGRPAVRFPNQLKFNPLKYVRTLLEAVIGDGCNVYTNTSGSDIESNQLTTESGSVRFEDLVIATHSPIEGNRGKLAAAMFQTKLAAYSTYAIQATVDPCPEALLWDTEDPYNYYRFDQAPDQCSLIIGGQDHKTGQLENTEDRYDQLRSTLFGKFPNAKIQHRWSGQVLETPDGLPFIGRVDDHEFLATGFAGNGMTMGTFSGMLIADLIVRRQNEFERIFSPDRKAFSGTWEYLMENKDFPALFIKDRLARAETADNDIAPDSGAIVRRDGNKRAIYRDRSGNRTILSPVCPHMGCIVNWNEAERTWDCPCHGSRFAPTGEVIAGPAETGLEKCE